MNNQTRNHLNLQKHIADQDHIIRVRNAEIAALRKLAEKAEKERDDKGAAYDQLKVLFGSAERAAIGWSARAQDAEARADQPRPLTADDITDELVERALMVNAALFPKTVRRMLTAALTEPPTRPEGAEKVEAVLHQYWSGDINGDDLADRIAEEMNR